MLKNWHTCVFRPRRLTPSLTLVMGKAERHLSRRERPDHGCDLRHRRRTAAEVHERLPDAPSRTSVRTLLGILEAKGHLKHIQDGPRYVYRPVRSRQDVGRSSLRRVLDTFFEGSLERAVAAHLSDSAADLSPDDLAQSFPAHQPGSNEREMNMAMLSLITDSTLEIATWALADLALKGTLLFAMAALIAIAASWFRSSAATRHLIWLVAVVSA